jgi:phosphate uptake regulator
MMHQRKIQLIAGSTYSVSLPKEWVLKNSLKEKSIVSIIIHDDESLIINPQSQSIETTNKINLNIDEYGTNIGQVLFSLYYSGFEDITLVSSRTIPDRAKLSIKKKINYMSGTEIVYEDSQKIRLKVLLDTKKLDINQIFFRICLLINSSIDVLMKGKHLETIELNEDEVDRLYHLTAKILSLSSLNSDILKSSNVKYSSNIVPFSLISKKLENIADNIFLLRNLVNKPDEEISSILNFINKNLRNNTNYLIGKQNIIFDKTPSEIRNKIKKQVNKISDVELRINLYDCVKYVFDIEEELVNSSFYKVLKQLE